MSSTSHGRAPVAVFANFACLQYVRIPRLYPQFSTASADMEWLDARLCDPARNDATIDLGRLRRAWKCISI